MIIALTLAYSVSQAVPAPQPRIRVRSWTGYKCRISPEMYRTPMATTVWMEARDQPTTGQRVVAFIIKNRVKADKKRWGHGLLGVVTKYKQFSAHNCFHGRIDKNRQAFFDMLKQPEDSKAKRQWRAIQKLTRDVWRNNVPDNSGGATFYATATANPYWKYEMTVVGQIGDHVMFRPQTAHEAALYRRDMAANAKLARARRIARRAHNYPRLTVRHRVRHH